MILRRRLTVEGMQGRGPVRYSLNPHAGWNRQLKVRAEQARPMPRPFDLIEGGAAS